MTASDDERTTTLSSPNSNKVYIFERDIDLLLLEEFHSSTEFQNWFAGKVLASAAKLTPSEIEISGSALPANVLPDLTRLRFLDAQHSVADFTGESDLLLTYTDDRQKWLILVEDKIDAIFQKDQALRYFQRARGAIGKDGVAWATTVLAAPQKYFGDNEQKHGFQARLTYEEIAEEWFKGEAKLGKRGIYKAYLLKTAIEKAVSGGSNPVVIKFCLDYWALAEARLPELKLLKPVKRTSTWTSIPLPGKPDKVSLIHKMGEGKMDLQFSDMSLRLDELSSRYIEPLRNNKNVLVVIAGNSGVLRLEVPPLDVYKPFEEQQEAAYQGMVAALRLIRIYENVIKTV